MPWWVVDLDGFVIDSKQPGFKDFVLENQRDIKEVWRISGDGANTEKSNEHILIRRLTNG